MRRERDDLENRYGDVPNTADMKKVLTEAIRHLGLVGQSGSVGEIVLQINDSAVAGIRKDKWKVC